MTKPKKPSFKPLKITLKSQEEVEALNCLLNHGILNPPGSPLDHIYEQTEKLVPSARLHYLHHNLCDSLRAHYQEPRD